MCEWCDRLVFMPSRWNKHAFKWADTFIITHTRKSDWHRNEYYRKEWHRARNYLYSLNNSVWTSKRNWKSARGIGSRYYSKNRYMRNII